MNTYSNIVGKIGRFGSIRISSSNITRYWMLCMFLCLLVACAPVAVPSPIQTVTPTKTIIPTSTPLPTWTPTPVPTPTAIPPARASLHWPNAVSALETVPIEVEFIPPAGVAANVNIRVSVMNPAAETVAVFDLDQREGFRYFSNEELQLPLDPLGGYWSAIAEVDTNLDVTGTRVLFFTPEQIHMLPLGDQLPQRIRLRIPVAFTQVSFQGGLYAGSRMWQHKDGQIGLWWAPGPTEKLLLSNAVTMLEATFPTDNPPVIVDVAETTWHDRTTFAFTVMWSDSQPGMAWVVQDNDFWLYALEIRALENGNIPVLIEEVASTFRFID